MNPRANITIDVLVRTRAEMNTATPRFGNWTYHHVQPVRIYYMTASLILRYITDADTFPETRTYGVVTLEKMCNNAPNKATLRTFVDTKKNTVTTDVERQAIAKTCASPPFGGFPGPNPGQRSDDPHDGPEVIKPQGAHAAWWATLTNLGTTALSAFGLHLMPAPNTALAATKTSLEWNEIVNSLLGDLEAASVNGAPTFQGRDWKVTDPAAGSWTMVSRAQAPAWDQYRGVWLAPCPQMALRVAREANSFLEMGSTPVASMAQRGTVPLTPSDDYLNYL